MAEYTDRNKESNFNIKLFLSICEKYGLSLKDMFKEDDETCSNYGKCIYCQDCEEESEYEYDDSLDETIE